MGMKVFPSAIGLVFGKFYRLADGGITPGYEANYPTGFHPEGGRALARINNAQTPTGAGTKVKQPSARTHLLKYGLREPFDLWQSPAH
jgi:hypothetical protein